MQLRNPLSYYIVLLKRLISVIKRFNYVVWSFAYALGIANGIVLHATTFGRLCACVS